MQSNVPYPTKLKRAWPEKHPGGKPEMSETNEAGGSKQVWARATARSQSAAAQGESAGPAFGIHQPLRGGRVCPTFTIFSIIIWKFPAL
jgi:hypothetical protein